MRSHIGSPKALGPVTLRRFPRDLHSVAKQASFYIASGTDFSGFGNPNGPQKSMFELFFSMSFSKAFWHRNFIDFWKLESRKIAIFLGENKIFTKSAFSIKIQKQWNFIPFSEAKTKKIPIKIDLRKHCFWASHFQHFFFDFGSILNSKNHRKITSSRKNWGSKACSGAVSLWSCFLNGFWNARSSISMDFRTSRRCFLIALSGEQKYAWSMSGCRPYFDD